MAEKKIVKNVVHTGVWETIGDNLQAMIQDGQVYFRAKLDGDYGVTTNSKGAHNYSITARTQGIGFVKFNGLEVNVFVGKRITPTRAEIKAAKQTPAPASASAPASAPEIDYDKLAAALVKMQAKSRK